MDLLPREAEASLATSGGALVESWLSGMSANTVAAYARDLADFASFVNASSPGEAASRLLAGPGEANRVCLAYRGYLLGDCGLSPATVNRRLAALRSLVKLARTLGLVTWALEVRNVPAKGYRDTRGPGRSGVVALLGQIRGDGLKARRDRAMVRLLYDLGLRRGEVVGLDVEHVDLERCSLAVMGKGRREREVLTLPGPTCEALSEWIEARGSEPGPLFTNADPAGKGKRLTGTSLYRIVRGYGERAGVVARPHGLRHTAITQAVKAGQAAGYPLEVALDFSRHADIRTLMVYRDRNRDYQGELAGMVAGGVARTRGDQECTQIPQAHSVTKGALSYTK